MQINSKTPATKPQPVVVLGAVVAGATTITSGLAVLFKDNPTAVLWIGVAGLVVSGIGVAKDQFVKSQVVPVDDVVAYVNDERVPITGPASTQPDGLEVHNVLVSEPGQSYHDGSRTD